MKNFNELLKHKAYYVYDYKLEEIQVAEGDEHDTAYDLYAQVTKDAFANDEEKWALDIALDCVRNMPNDLRERIQKEGEIPFYHFGYGVYVRNHYIHSSSKHLYLEADYISSTVEKFIYAILCPKE